MKPVPLPPHRSEPIEQDAEVVPGPGGSRRPVHAAPTAKQGTGAGGRAAARERRRTEGEAPAPAQSRKQQRRRPNPLELDRLIHERVRLGIVSALAVNETQTFNELKQLLGTTDGNLSVHARRLEDAGYIECRKSFDGRVPRTEYGLTSAGRAALRRYLDHMDSLIRRVREA